MKNFILISTSMIVSCAFGQSISQKDTLMKVPVDNLKFNKNQLIIPVVFFTYGILALDSDYLKDLNFNIRDEVKEHIDKKFSIDDISQYTPALSVYVLNFSGIKGKNNLKDRSIILATSYIIMSSATIGIKSWAKVERPDGSSNNSFPSGHTATAFSGAEFLWQEYKDVNIWYGISGYIVATGTGFFRIYNARHWLSDVVMGAGIGILSTKVAYWVFPFAQNKLFRSCKNTTAVIAPFYNGKQLGFGLIMNLK